MKYVVKIKNGTLKNERHISIPFYALVHRKEVFSILYFLVYDLERGSLVKKSFLTVIVGCTQFFPSFRLMLYQ